MKTFATFIVLFALTIAPVYVSHAGESPANPPPPPPTAVPTQTLQTPLTEPTTNPSSSAFKIAVCDGPAGANKNNDPKYVPCDFNAVMLLIQHLINIMMVIGVLVAIVMFSFAGWLMITGTEKNISRAKSIFPKVFIGFIIMLSAWFIVYQVLSWLASNDGFKALLGTP